MNRWEEASSIVRTLVDKGYQAYLVGGCVRDFLLKREIKDFDVVTNALPENIQGIFPRTFAKGKSFGVISVLIEDREYEVATYRKDLEYVDGRHPVGVVFTNLEEDVKRRDFTINALVYDVFTKEVIDLVHGLEDLAAKCIKTIGNPYERFKEDKLRMLRAVRFSNSLGFTLDDATRSALCEMYYKIIEVSPERIRDEITKMLSNAGASKALDMLQETGLLKVVLPEIEAMVGVEQPKDFHPEGTVYEHVRLMYKLAEYPLSSTLAWGILLHDVGKPPVYKEEDRITFKGHVEEGMKMSKEILIKYRFSNKFIEDVSALVNQHMRFKDVKNMRVSTLKKFLFQENFDEHLELHRLDCLASHGSLENYQFCKLKSEEFKDEKQKFKLVVDGNDLISWGYKPGPLFKEILSFVEEGQLSGKIVTKDWAKFLIEKEFLK